MTRSDGLAAKPPMEVAVMWSAWSRYWVACSTGMLRWYLACLHRVEATDGILETRVSRDGTRWAILSSGKTNVIHLQRRARRGAGLVRPVIDVAGEQNNVVPFVSTYLRRATLG